MYRVAAVCAVHCLIICQGAEGAEPGTELRSGVHLVVNEMPFIATGHTIAGCQPYRPCFIDGHRVFSAIGLPKTMLVSVRISYLGNNYQLDVAGMYDPLLGPDLRGRWDGYCYDGRNCTVRAVLGDAGGSYAAEWQVVNGVVTRTILTDSADVVNFIRSNLLAPRYE
jgi:hypothetical protein